MKGFIDVALPVSWVEPARWRNPKRRSTEETEEKKKIWLVFRTCKARCLACGECGYFWGPDHDKLAGQPARFGIA